MRFDEDLSKLSGRGSRLEMPVLTDGGPVRSVGAGKACFLPAGLVNTKRMTNGLLGDSDLVEEVLGAAEGGEKTATIS